jgi:hypothetical protein
MDRNFSALRDRGAQVANLCAIVRHASCADYRCASFEFDWKKNWLRDIQRRRNQI